MRSIYVVFVVASPDGRLAGGSLWGCARAISIGSGATLGADSVVPGCGFDIATWEDVTVTEALVGWVAETFALGAGDGVSPAITCGAGSMSTITAAKTAAAENGRSERLRFNGMDSPR